MIVVLKNSTASQDSLIIRHLVQLFDMEVEADPFGVGYLSHGRETGLVVLGYVYMRVLEVVHQIDGNGWDVLVPFYNPMLAELPGTFLVDVDQVGVDNACVLLEEVLC